MKVIASKIWNKLNNTKWHWIGEIKYLTLLLPTMPNWINETMHKWGTMKVSASKIWNVSNITKNVFNQKNNCSYLAVTDDVRLNWQNNECQWWSMELSESKIWNNSNCPKISRWIWTVRLNVLVDTTKILDHGECLIISWKSWSSVQKCNIQKHE